MPELLSSSAFNGEQADYVTSVCMGAFLLGAVGLLNGRRAATHLA
jgi:cyclohexyl-isocyanide hydratase